MSSTTIKVPIELRDRLARLARREHTTLAGAIERSLDASEDAAFWERVAQTMDGAGRSAAELGGTLSDGLEPEDWSDVL